MQNVLGGALPDDDPWKLVMISCEVWLITVSSSGPRFILSEAVRGCQGQMSNKLCWFLWECSHSITLCNVRGLLSS